MTEKERFIKTLKREKIGGRVPAFELVFYLTMEAFGRVHPAHRVFSQWNQMTEKERKLQIRDAASVYIETARRYHHSAIFPQFNIFDYDYGERLIDSIREQSGDEFYIMIHGDPTFAIPDGDGMMDFSVRLFEDGDNLKKEARKSLETYLEMAERYRGKGLDGFALCSDYCFNSNPFMSPEQFGEFVAPYLERVLAEYRAMGYYTIKHTDGNIMPILDMMVECKPDAIHSLDPQGGVDLGEVSDKYGDKVCLIGNVNCALLQNGSEEEIERDVRRSLSQGMKRGKGYVFGTSNCVYTGLPLERYEFMMKIYEKYGTYDEEK